MSNAADVPISPQGLQQQQPAALAQETVSSQQLSAEQTSEGEVIESQVGDAEDREGQPDGAFRRRAPPVLSSEQLRSPLATPGKSPSIAINPSASIAAAADSNDEYEEEQLPQRRPRRESVAAAAAAAAAAKAAASAPTLATPQELVDWCIAQAVSVTTLPFEQAPSSVAAQVAAFSAVFQEQVRVAVLCFPSVCSIMTRSCPCIEISINSLQKSVASKVTVMSLLSHRPQTFLLLVVRMLGLPRLRPMRPPEWRQWRLRKKSSC